MRVGGKCAFIILEDADVELAAKLALNAIMFNCGQVCLGRRELHFHTSGIQ